MSLETVRQLCQHLEKLVPMIAEKSAAISMVTMFNANLTEAKREYQHHPILSALTQAQEQVPIGDLLIRTGQLLAILQEEADETLKQQDRHRGIKGAGSNFV